MATATILQLPQAISVTGSEQIEGTQNGSSVRMTSAQVAGLASSVIPTGPVGVAAAAPAAGANNDYTVDGQMGASIGFVDLTPTADCNITGLQAGFNGQLVTVTNLSTYSLTLNALNSGSQSANQFRMVADFVLTQNNSKSFKYSTTIGVWVSI